ncbi:MAG: hypothetical protein EAZ74_00575 [Alphaproteobacteria bacterium]|nr:MAG: hypothetical protein EAY76_01375 [Alphaproteobacteria bacterium]TAF15928.1 MAG: hypothetical protein EAZ74_00575 [Alphaproteobacteria bacterium]TAF76742.1 MAG: hypothetical protein EAZ52_03030 [Alphaproteobacteria bacterium]
MRDILWIALCMIGALMLYELKYQVHTAHETTLKLERELRHEREQLHMAEVEWTYVSRPERVAALAQTHLQLTPIAPEQIMQRDTVFSALTFPEQPTIHPHHHAVALPQGVR